MSHMAPRKLLVTSCLSWYLRQWRYAEVRKAGTQFRECEHAEEWHGAVWTKRVVSGGGGGGEDRGVGRNHVGRWDTCFIKPVLKKNAADFSEKQQRKGLLSTCAKNSRIPFCFPSSLRQFLMQSHIFNGKDAQNNAKAGEKNHFLIEITDLKLKPWCSPSVSLKMRHLMRWMMGNLKRKKESEAKWHHLDLKWKEIILSIVSKF